MSVDLDTDLKTSEVDLRTTNVFFKMKYPDALAKIVDSEILSLLPHLKYNIKIYLIEHFDERESLDH